MTINNRPQFGARPAMPGAKPQPKPVSPTAKAPEAVAANTSLPSLVEVPNDNVIRRGLDGLAPVLNYVGYKSYYNPANDDVPFEQLFVSTAYEGTEEELEESPMIQVVFLSDLARAMDPDIPEETTASHILQFFVQLPTLGLEDEKKSQIHELLSVMTKLLPIGYFSYNDSDGIFYRYTMLTPTKNLDDTLIVEIVGMISFFITNAYEKIKTFVDEDLPYEEMIEQLEKGFISAAREDNN